jgi:thioredoxin 1
MKVIKFEATWCGPCKMLSKVISESQDKIKIPFDTVDIDRSTELAMEYGVRGVPTMILVDENNTEIRRKIGVVNQSELLEFLG